MKDDGNLIDKALHRIIDRYLGEIVWALLVLIAVAIRLLLIPSAQSDDYTIFLQPWVETYRGHSISECLAMSVGNYFVPYNLFLIFVSRLSVEPYVPIAFFSCAADIGIAYGIWKIVRGMDVAPKVSTTVETATRASVLVLLMPYVFLNSALWKQCDSVYVCFMVLSLCFLLEKRPTLSFILLGIALSFKLQTVFILPFYLYHYAVKKDHSILQWLWLPGIYLAAGLPALFAGKTFSETFGIYKTQIEEPGGIVRNLPNVYYLGLPPDDVAKLSGICFTVAVLAVAFYFMYRRGVLGGAKEDEPKSGVSIDELLVAAFFIWTCVMFLPGMHERYDYPVTLLITVYALLSRKRGMVVVAIALQLIDVMDYSYFLFYWSLIEPSKLTLPFIAAYLWTGREVFAGTGDQG